MTDLSIALFSVGLVYQLADAVIAIRLLNNARRVADQADGVLLAED
jgi:hypothetical protein